MEIKFFVNSDSDNVINKTLSNGIVLNVNLRRDFDYINPSLTIANVNGLDITNYNYMEIPEFNRKYFIRNIINVSNSIYRIECECDYIETFKNEIINSNCLYKTKISDGDFLPVEIDSTGKTLFTDITSSVTFEDGETMILNTLGDL